MLPERLIPAVITNDRVIPTFLGAEDLPWIGVLLEEMFRFSGRPVRDLEERMAVPLPCAAPTFKRRAAQAYLFQLFQPIVSAELKPPIAREALFLAAAAAPHGIDRDAIVAEVAQRLGLSSAGLEQAIVADLPGERLVIAPKQPPAPRELVQAINQLIVRSLVARARSVSIRAEGSIRPLVRQAKLAGLLCTLREGPEAGSSSLEVSGPFSLFRHTVLYGRALATLLTRLPYCAHFELTAVCRLRGQEVRLTLRGDDPVFQLTPGAEPRIYDSKVEERFAKELCRAAPEWDLIREPEAVRAGSTLIFPDFALVDRLDPSRRFLIEIVGFWTPAYLTRKLAELRLAGRHDLILCIDEARKCDDADLPADARVVRYRRRVRPKDVLTAIGVIRSR